MRAPGSEGHVSLVTKLGFGSGDIFGGGAMTLIGVYYLFFLTDVLRINPSLAGIVILISKTWDAVSDPLMGTIRWYSSPTMRWPRSSLLIITNVLPSCPSAWFFRLFLQWPAVFFP